MENNIFDNFQIHLSLSISKLNRFGLRYWNQKAQFYKFNSDLYLKFKLVFFNSHYFYFSDKGNYFSILGIRNFRNSTNDQDKICRSIAVNLIYLTYKLKEINEFENC